MGEEVRGQWGRQLEFILTMVGYAVGLGNVWRFPYLCYKNGGGAFLVPYVICLILLGIPMFALECSFGQFGGKGPLSIWSINPTFKGLGVSMVVTSIIVFIYYDVIIAWALRFLVASFTTDLPWVDCKDCECLLYSKNLTEPEVEVLRYNNSLGVPCLNISVNGTPKSPSELYFTNEILQDSGDIEVAGEVLWPLVACNFVAYGIIFLVLLKGIESLGKVVYFTAIFPYILLTILLVRSAQLDGAYDGVIYYLRPDWSRLSDAEVWKDAAVQIFFSLSACMGGLIAMSSYNKFNNNIVRDSFLVPIINCCTSFYAGFVVFSTLGHMAKIKGVDVDDVTEGGLGLAFVVYPEALASMPVSTLWAICFFFMLCILGFSTQFSAAETIMTSIIDEFPGMYRSRKRQVLFRMSVCLLAFVLGIPMLTEGGTHLFDLVEEAAMGFPLLVIGFFEFVVIAWIYGYKKFSEDMKAMMGFSPFVYFRITWVYVSPVLLMAVIVFMAYQMEDHYPAWTGLLYYLEVLFILGWIPGWFLYYTWVNGVNKMMQAQRGWTMRRNLGDNTGPPFDDNGLALEKAMDGGFLDYSLHVKPKGKDNLAFVSEQNGGSHSNLDNNVPPPDYNGDNATKF